MQERENITVLQRDGERILQRLETIRDTMQNNVARGNYREANRLYLELPYNAFPQVRSFVQRVTDIRRQRPTDLNEYVDGMPRNMWDLLEDIREISYDSIEARLRTYPRIR